MSPYSYHSYFETNSIHKNYVQSVQKLYLNKHRLLDDIIYSHWFQCTFIYQLPSRIGVATIRGSI